MILIMKRFYFFTHRGDSPRVSADYSLLNSLFDSLFKLFLGAGFS